MKNKSYKVLIIADGYPTPKNYLAGVYIKEQINYLRMLRPNWTFDVYYNPFFRIFSNSLKKKSFFWNAIKWSMQLICFFPYLFKKYDLIHAHRFFFPVLNGAAYKFFHHKVPLVVSSHGIVQIRKRYNNRLTRKLFHYCNLIIAMNHEMKKEFISKFDLLKSDVVVRSCGINFPMFDSLEKEPKDKSKDSNIITLGFVGVFSENKRPYYFIKCIEALRDKYHIQGIMIGGGKNIDKIKKYVFDNQLPIIVKDTLPYSEVIKYYPKFDLLIFPSFNETFGIVGIEALYCNVPVVASAVGGKIDYIQENVNGILFENGNLDDMIQKTEDILKDKNKLNYMKSRARQSVEEYSNEKVIQEILEYYDQLIEAR